MPFVPIAILGAGLTGLSAALAVQRRGGHCRVFEQAPGVGGHASTVEERGYRFDRTGHLLHLRSEELRADVLGWLDGQCVELERRSVVYSHGVYTRYPYQANTHGLPPAVAYECLLGFLEAREKPERVAKNFEEYCRFNFGEGFSRHFMLPYNERLFGVPLSEITSDWCDRFVPRPKLEDVLAGALGLPDRKLGYNARFLYPRGGIGELPAAMARGVRDLTLRAAPIAIRAARRELVFERELVGYERLVSTIPLPALLDLFDELPPAVRAARERLRASELYYLDVALTGRPKKDFHWAYVPEPRFPFYRVGQYTAFSPALAPPGCSSLYVELVQRTRFDLERGMPEVVQGLVELGLITGPSQIEFVRLRHLSHAYVLYDHAHAGALATIEPFLAENRVLSSGRYGGWNYSSMEDALRFGREAAGRALDSGST
jgi:protoporphyrinogen oxidase